MIIYLISIAIFIYIFFNGFDGKDKKAKILTLIAVAVSGYDLFYIISGNISQVFLINLLLCIIPAIVFFVGLLFLSDNSPDKTKEDDNIDEKPTEEKNNKFNVDIIDNEISSIRSPETNDSKTYLTGNEPINFQNAKVEGFGSCDVIETTEYMKITMRADGKEFEFYVKDANIVAYRLEGMTKPQSY